jgi:RNA-directed DNA polymerase
MKYLSDAYRNSALEKGISEAELDVLAKYCARLESNRAPVIFDAEHFSFLVGYDITLLYAMANDPGKFYRTFYVLKSNGGKRRIDEPRPTLKEVQQFILRTIALQLPVSKVAKAFQHNSNVKKNARLHLRQREILKLDIEDFFPSVKFRHLYPLFFNLGYTKQLATLFAKLCCFDDRLPQGACTSPALANAALYEIDEQILSLIREHQLRYTRYADDLMISGEKIPNTMISNVRSLLKNAGFALNENKTSIMRDGGRKIVTGVVVNSKMQTARNYRREFRQQTHFIRKYGLDGHLRYTKETRANTLDFLIGKGTFIVWVNPHDTRAQADLAFLKAIKREYFQKESHISGTTPTRS